jgi:hypothetical protein
MTDRDIHRGVRLESEPTFRSDSARIPDGFTPDSESDIRTDSERREEKRREEKKDVAVTTHLPPPLRELARHLQHRLYLTSLTTLRCVDCTHTVDLRPLLRGLPATSSDPCPIHPGYSGVACGPCRSEQLAAETPLPVLPAGAPMPDDFRQQVQAARRTTP